MKGIILRVSWKTTSELEHVDRFFVRPFFLFDIFELGFECIGGSIVFFLVWGSILTFSDPANPELTWNHLLDDFLAANLRLKSIKHSTSNLVGRWHILDRTGSRHCFFFFLFFFPMLFGEMVQKQTLNIFQLG